MRFLEHAALVTRATSAILTDFLFGAQAEGFSVVKTYCGHGIGDLFHCAPNVPHYANNKAVGLMKPGHVFTIEVRWH